MNITAAVLHQMGLPRPYTQTQPLRLQTLQLDEPGVGEMRVRITAAGLCHSDLAVIEGKRPRPLPMALGHEATGVVDALGPHTQGFAIGDAVVFSFVPSCGHCLPCAEGRPALCEPGAAANTAGALLGGTQRLRAEHRTVHHHLGVSGFASHAVVSAHSAVKVPADLPPAVAALFGCAVMTGVGAVVNTAKVQPGQSVAVFGCGGVGLAAVLGAVAAGAHPIVAIDINPQKLAHAQAMGATHTVQADAPDAIATVRARTQGGADVAIETVGSEIVLANAYAATRRGGTTITVGLPHPSKALSIPALSLVAEERSLKGSYMGSAVPLRDIPRYVALYQAGRLPVDKLLTHTLRLAQINEGFERLAAGEGIRQVIVMEDG